MKNKKLTSGLLVVVVLVWGVIFYKIFNGLRSSGKVVYSKSMDNNRKDTEMITNDTFNIINNYRDPFLGSMAVDHVKKQGQPLKDKQTIQPVKPMQVVKWPNVVFGGIIRKKEASPVAIVKIDGHSDFMTEGSTSSGVQLQELYNDSIRVVFDGEKKVIKK